MQLLGDPARLSNPLGFYPLRSSSTTVATSDYICTCVGSAGFVDKGGDDIVSYLPVLLRPRVPVFRALLDILADHYHATAGANPKEERIRCFVTCEPS